MGFAFLPTPGHSCIIIVIGIWMLAGEFIRFVRFFDRLDVSQRKLKWWIKNRWSRLPAVVKVLMILICVGPLGCGTHSLISSG